MNVKITVTTANPTRIVTILLDRFGAYASLITLGMELPVLVSMYFISSLLNLIKNSKACKSHSVSITPTLLTAKEKL